MKRLTEQVFGRYRLKSTCRLDTLQGARAVVDRLGAYEDAGLEPEEIKAAQNIVRSVLALEREVQAFKNMGLFDHLQELVQAEKEGRLVVLPCKVGSTVYAIEYDRDACYDCDDYSPYEFGDCNHSPYYLLFPDIRSVKERICPKHILCVNEREMTLSYWETQRDYFGKTVFLTREEAEAALEAQKEGSIG